MRTCRRHSWIICGLVFGVPHIAFGTPWEIREEEHMLTGRDNFGATVGGDGKIYAIGGDTGAPGVTASVECFLEDAGCDPNRTGSWSYSVPLPSPIVSLSAATDGYGRVYAIGGAKPASGGTDEVWRYDPNGPPMWDQVASLPDGDRRQHCSVTDSQGRIYAIGGLAGPGGTVLASMERYDPDTNTWTQPGDLADMGTPRYLFAALIDSNDQIFVFGGAIGGGETAFVEMYNPITNMWGPVTLLPGGPRQTQGTVGPDGLFYLGGGWTGSSYTNRVDRYDPNTNTWFDYDDLNRYTNNFEMVTGPCGWMYALGGDYGDDTVERSIPEPTILSLLALGGLALLKRRQISAWGVIRHGPRR